MMLNAFFLCLLPPRDLLSQKDIAYFKIAFVCIQLSFECSFHILGKVLCWIFVFQILSFMFSFPWQYLLQSKNFNSCKILCIIFSYIDDAQGFFFPFKMLFKIFTTLMWVQFLLAIFIKCQEHLWCYYILSTVII